MKCLYPSPRAHQAHLAVKKRQASLLGDITSVECTECYYIRQNMLYPILSHCGLNISGIVTNVHKIAISGTRSHLPGPQRCDQEEICPCEIVVTNILSGISSAGRIPRPAKLAQHQIRVCVIFRSSLLSTLVFSAMRWEVEVGCVMLL
jgi:hypothetical protein